MSNAVRRFQIFTIVRDYFFEYQSEETELTVESALPLIKGRIRSDFRESSFLELLLLTCDQQIPLFVRLFKKV